MLLAVYFTSLLVEVIVFCHRADGASSITWYEPPPVETTSDHNLVRLNCTQIIKGSINATLRWTFSLSQDLSISSVQIIFKTKVIASISSGGQAGVTLGFTGRFGISWNSQTATLIIFNVSAADDGEFSCKVTTFEGGIRVWTRKIKVKVVVPPKLTNTSNDQTVREGSSLQLFCEASGSPRPNITWTRILPSGSESEVLYRDPTWNIVNINDSYAGVYRCRADNGAGNPVDHEFKVTVLSVPRVNIEDNFYVERKQNAFLYCEVEGYPPPTITWTPCKPQEHVCDNSFLNISKVQKSTEIYTCAANNSLGNTSESTNLVIGGYKIYLTVTITSEKCIKGQYDESFWKKLKEVVGTLFEQNIYSEAILLDVRCGSLVVDLAVTFTTIVREDWVLSVFRNATKGGTLGEFSVNASSIVGIAPVIPSTTKLPTSTTTPKPDDDKTAIIVGAVVGSLVAVAIIVAVVIWCVQKKKKQQGKGTKEVGDDQDAGQGKSGAPASAGHGLNNSGYFDAGSASGYANASGLPPAKPPSKKQNKQEKGTKQKETNEQQALPLYAQVDKSKKTPKPPLNTYDQVERSRKSQPGEVMYTQVEQVNPGGSMPRAAASPVRRPPAYDDTQYAELII